MSRGWRAATVVAGVYAHFLIFAQFSWVELMRAAGISPTAEKGALAAMALAGIAAGFVTARLPVSVRRLRGAMAVAALVAAIAPWCAAWPMIWLISASSGASIGVMTVSLAPLLPRWGGIGWTGVGTGLGYALCNLPPVFLAGPGGQALLGASFALVGAWAAPAGEDAARPAVPSSPRSLPVVAVVIAFTALVWLDSAAFFIIQHTRDMKQATWGEPMLWRNAAVHLAAALVAGWGLRRGLAPVLVAAWVLLAIAALAVNGAETRALAGWFYPVGVSLYSTALVAWPGYLSGAIDSRGVARRAAWLFAIAGWFGSANGIGMAEALQRVPTGFVIGAGVVVAGALALARGKGKEAIGVVFIGALAWPWQTDSLPTKSSATAAERGKAVYLAEGCIHCHSRYVRPGSTDEIRWGPVDEAAALAEHPVLAGNRRQGPDLQQVGARRSARWLELHFLNPRDFAPASPMPSYRHLFEDSRGADLIEWLKAVPPGAVQSRLQVAASWQPGEATPPRADGATLFAIHCAVCHGAGGNGNGRLATSLAKPPANLVEGPFVWTPEGGDLELRIARVVKFGLAGTDMPGHETLDDARVMALARQVKALREGR